MTLGSERALAASSGVIRGDPWRAIRRRYRWAIGLWLGWIPCGIVLIQLQDRILPAPWPLALALAYMTGFVVAGARLARSTCPACDRRFRPMNRSAPRYAPWSRRCQSCGARIGDPVSPPLHL